MKYDFDLICIGLVPAGMAVSVMRAELGLIPNREYLLSISML